MRPVIVIQARLGSTRLPGKILLPLGGKPSLRWTYDACERTGYDVVIACPPEDAAPIRAAFGWRGRDRRVTYTRYPDEDVLGRYVVAAEDAPVVVRITGDCYCPSPRLIQAAVTAIEQGAEYAGNTIERHWPRGLDVESFTPELLRLAHQNATTPYDREHVTPWMQVNDNPKHIPQGVYRLSGASKDWRWCLDRPEDYRWAQGAFTAIPDPSCETLRDYSRTNPPPTD